MSNFEEAAGLLEAEAARIMTEVRGVSADCSFAHWNMECARAGGLESGAKLLREAAKKDEAGS